MNIINDKQRNAKMTILYKLTNADWTTRNNTKWGPNVTHTVSGKGELCQSGWLHAYLSPELAVLLNPIHADINNFVLWSCEGEIGKNDRNLKVGCASLTTIEILEAPVFTINQKIYFSIQCALKVYKNKDFEEWSNDWINNKDRSKETALKIANADADAYVAAYATTAAAADAANAAAAYAAAAADLILIAKEAQNWIE